MGNNNQIVFENGRHDEIVIEADYDDDGDSDEDDYD
jgi:hypothetical protein